MDAPRWPRRSTDEGVDPAPLFSFADERMFLAWIRTVLVARPPGLGSEHT